MKPKLYVNFENFEKKIRKVWVFESKNAIFGSKSSEKFGKVWKSLEKGFSKHSEISENYEKITLNLNFGNREKLVPTQKPTQKFG